MPAKQPIVIVGGGFGGVAAALTLDRLLGDDLRTPIFLIDPSAYHVYTPVLYELLDRHAPHIPIIRFSDILAGTRVHHVQQSVTRIDTEARRVMTEEGQLPYDQLVMALPSQPTIPKKQTAVPVITLGSWEDILDLRAELESCLKTMAHAALPEKLVVAVIGGGLHGVAYTAALSRLLKQEERRHKLKPGRSEIILCEQSSRLLPKLPPEAGQCAARFLKQQGVKLVLHTDGETLLTHRQNAAMKSLMVWTVGSVAHPLIAHMKGLRHDSLQRVLVDSSLQAIDMPSIWVVGDAVSLVDCDFTLAAVAHGKHVAQAIAAMKRGDVPLAYQPRRWPVMIPFHETYAMKICGDSVVDGTVIAWQKRWHDLDYLTSILPWSVAWHVWRSRGGIQRNGDQLSLATYLLPEEGL